MTQDVRDKKAEIGINLSVVIQGLILASLLGFGNYIVGGLEELNTSVKKLTREIAFLNTSTTLNKSEIVHNSLDITKLREDLDEHIHQYPHNVGKR